jgi:hypothetical protein
VAVALVAVQPDVRYLRIHVPRYFGNLVGIAGRIGAYAPKRQPGERRERQFDLALQLAVRIGSDEPLVDDDPVHAPSPLTLHAGRRPSGR